MKKYLWFLIPIFPLIMSICSMIYGFTVIVKIFFIFACLLNVAFSIGIIIKVNKKKIKNG